MSIKDTYIADYRDMISSAMLFHKYESGVDCGSLVHPCVVIKGVTYMSCWQMRCVTWMNYVHSNVDLPWNVVILRGFLYRKLAIYWIKNFTRCIIIRLIKMFYFNILPRFPLIQCRAGWRNQMKTFSVLLALCRRRILLTKAREEDLWYFHWLALEQTRTIETAVVWDTIALIMTSL